MITNKKKNEKTTEIYFDETPAPVVIRTHNTALKKRLLSFAEKFPDLCRLTDDDEFGCLSFEIDCLPHYRAIHRGTQGIGESQDERD